LGALYGAITARRMARPGLRVDAFVVCMGNFVAGGAGKTPAAIATADLLRERGERVAFLSRGYAGASRTGVFAVDPAVHRAEEVGDEPLLLARAAQCFVARDRRLAARAAIAAGASVLILDDGLQSPALVKDFSFAVIDGGAGFGNGLCVPAGPLRAQPAKQLPNVSAVIIVDGVSDASIEAYRAVAGKVVVNARLEPDRLAAAKLRHQNVLAFAGIGRPAKFFETLDALGARVVVARGFADHQRYSPAQLDALLAQAARLGLTPVTTEKDFVRLPPAYAREISVLPVALLFDDAPAVSALLADALARWRASR
jgi:tetraacyldisaccharide 4'-kinase